MKLSVCLVTLFLSLLFPYSTTVIGAAVDYPSGIQDLVGERLEYDISFLWFDHLAEGELALSRGEEPGTYLVTLQARTLGVAAYLTRSRRAKYQTLMAADENGMLYPLWHTAHDIRKKGNQRKEKISKYSFDFINRKVRYQKQKNGRVHDDKWYALEGKQPVYDILTALYNLRLGFYGDVKEGPLLIPTFHHKGFQNIIIEPVALDALADRAFFVDQQKVAKILVDPSVFGTKGRDIYASFDRKNRPYQGIVKGVIGLGDVKGTLRSF